MTGSMRRSATSSRGRRGSWARLMAIARDRSERDLGHAGAAAGLAEVAKTALSLAQQILPPPNGPQFWLRNRAEGPRPCEVSVSSLGGNHQFVALEETRDRASAAMERSVESTARPTTARSVRDRGR